MRFLSNRTCFLLCCIALVRVISVRTTRNSHGHEVGKLSCLENESHRSSNESLNMQGTEIIQQHDNPGVNLSRNYGTTPFQEEATFKPKTWGWQEWDKPVASTTSSVGVAVIMGLVGYCLQKQGVITSVFRKGAADTVSRALLPCLLFTSILECPPCDYWKAHLPPEQGGCFKCRDVPEKLASAVYVLVWPLLTTLVGLFFGWLVTVIFTTPEDFRGGIIGTITFCNNTAMPSVILLVVYLRLASKGVDSIEEPLQYHAFYLLLTPFLQATIGARLFGVGQPELSNKYIENQSSAVVVDHSVVALVNTEKDSVHQSDSWKGIDPDMLPYPQPSYTTDEVSDSISFETKGRDSNMVGNQIDSRSVKRSSEGSETEPLETDAAEDPMGFFRSLKRMFAETIDIVPERSLSSDKKTRMTTSLFGLADAGELLSTAASESTETESSKSSRFRTIFQNYLEPLAQGPIMAILFAILIGLVKPLRGLLVDVDRTGHAPSLNWIYLGLQRMGMSTLPTNMLILGASLADTPGVSALSLKLHIVIVVCRMVLVPAVTWGFVLCLNANIPVVGITSQRERCAVLLVVFGNSCFPTANNMSVLAHLGNQNGARLASSILFQYMVAPFIVTMWFTTFLGFVVVT